jgi:hypothetical protein
MALSRRGCLAAVAPELSIRHCRSITLPLLLAGVAAAGAAKAVLVQVDSDEAPGAAPPVAAQGLLGAGRPPVVVALVAAPHQVFLVVVAEVVSEMVPAEEGQLVPGTSPVVAQVLCLLVVVAMDDLVVA